MPSALQAQCWPLPQGGYWCDDGSGPIEPASPSANTPPSIAIQPGSMPLSQPSVPITIVMSDDYDLRGESFRVYRDSVDVTSQFSFTKTPVLYPTPVEPRMRGRATGFITLPDSGSVTLLAYICDDTNEPQCSMGSGSYQMSRVGVEVTPDAQFGTAMYTTAPKTHAFTVTNRGTSNGVFALSVECRDEEGDLVTGCSVQATVSVAAGGSASVNVTYAANEPGRTIGMMLTARHTTQAGVQDAGWAELTVRTVATSDTVAPLVEAVPLNAGATIERSQCVTVSTALRGAFECGDLRIVHGLPAHRTYNRAWAPVLSYNNQHAHPTPTVYADVTLPDSAQQPDSVQVVVRMRDGTIHQATYPGAQFVPGAPRRVGVQWNGLSMASGVHGYTLQVINHYGAVAMASDTMPGELAVVNRSQSAFGAGWWLSGWEQLICIDCSSTPQRRLWIGGDGSTRVYTSANGGQTWYATHPDGPQDSILRMPDGSYTRPLRGGGRIEFNALGEHVRTVNRLGQATDFDVQGSRLFGITVPVPNGGGTAPRWTFAYENFGSGLWRVKTIAATAPGAATRTVTMTHGGSDRRITAITDPGGEGVAFVYVSGTYQRWISRQQNRRNTWTYYSYANGKLSTARTQMEAVADPGKDLTTGFVVTESRGVAQDSSTAGVSVATSAVYTRIDGPRPATDVLDHTYLWLNGDGTIRRIRNPVGAETRIRYGDGRFPALATEVTSPSGMYTRAWYDAEGRTIASTVFGQYLPTESSTTYTAWDPDCHRPTMMTSTVADTTWIAYDPATCNPVWQRLGRDTDRTVSFTYYGPGTAHAGMVHTVTGPKDAQGARAVETVAYDARGNLRTTTSPLGFITLYEMDALGRDTAIYTPILADNSASDSVLIKQYGARQTIRYNATGLPWQTVSYGAEIDQPAFDGIDPGTTDAQTLTVTTTYDDEGSPLTVTREMDPNPTGLVPQVTRYVYDAAGRKTEELANEQTHQRWSYDQGSNAVLEVTARGDSIRSRYDAAGRSVWREVPQVVYGQTGGSCPSLGSLPYWNQCTGHTFPIFPNHGTGYSIPTEWTTYRYDISGNMVRAENADAVLARTYYPNGQIRTDSTAIRDFGAGNAFSKVYGIEYGYHEGRVTRVIHPTNLATSGDSADIFVYHPFTGELSAAQDRNGNLFQFHHDDAGRLTGMTMPGGITDTRQYDVAGRLLSRTETGNSSALLLSESYTYDARDKLLRVTAPGASTYAQWYSGLGHLVMTDWSNVGDPQYQREGFLMDPLGNVVQKHVYGPGEGGLDDPYPDFAYTLNLFLGRVEQVSRVNTSPLNLSRDDTFQTYDAAGNQLTSFQGVVEPDGTAYALRRRVDSRSYYGADNRLRAVQQYNDQIPGSGTVTGNGMWEEYRYDPLGRRVAVRTLRPDTLCNQLEGCHDATTYYVWAGDQILWEQRSVSGTTNEHAGGNVSYFHAGGIDRPLTIWKSGVGSVVTHQNWRGQLARGTYGEGTGRVGQATECPYYPATGCIPVAWPGWNTRAWNEEAAKPETTGDENYFFGSLAVGMRDASGMLYMRNRYYDPKSGQFTQPDPIGLAGGLNSYGFARGDPVSYTDPFGLCTPWPFCLITRARDQLRSASGSAQGHLENAAVEQFSKGGLNTVSGVALVLASSAVELTLPGGNAQEHHIATNKNWSSNTRGGPWSPRFAELFEEAGLNLESPENRVRVMGHAGPHSEIYHQTVYQRLVTATAGLSGEEFRGALIAELNQIGVEVKTPGSDLNKLVTRGP